MGLDFTTISDNQGPAVYLLGVRSDEELLTRLGKEIDAATPDSTQVVYVDIDSGNGAQIAQFYGFMREQLPVVLIVQDDDTLYHSWQGRDLPAPDMVAHYLNQITGADKA